MQDSPIFIHSLFRCGSTYLFKVFRRSPVPYHCFQEALHESVLQNRDSPGNLVSGEFVGREELRHGDMEEPHFKEVADAWPAWQHAISEADIYAGYFRNAADPEGLDLWRTLMSVSRSRPVFQECRSSGRIEQIKHHLGGVHLYLWRNPWDQWLSQESMGYFGIVNRLLMNAPGAPSILQNLREELADVPTQVDSIQKAIDTLYQHELTPVQRYRIFYSVWCLGLIEGLKHADICLNIDSLSRSLYYRSSMLEALADNGIAGLDLSDCQIPMGKAINAELIRPFRKSERNVHAVLAADPLYAPHLDRMLMMRKQHSPRG